MLSSTHGLTFGKAFQKAKRSLESSSRVKRAYCNGGPSKKSAPLKPIVVQKSGIGLIHDPLYNKGTAWPKQERDRLGLRGLVPPAYLDLNLQIARITRRFSRISDPLEKYLFLSNLQDRNETLFYKVLSQNLAACAPIVYTPTVGLACQQYSFFYRRARGMYFSAADKGQFAAMVYNWPVDNVEVIVVTDGSRVLGLGDLGAHGIGISIGKLTLYVAAGGIHPQKTLPIVIDVGTDNEKLLNDPLYIGLSQPRLRGEEYFELIDEFMRAVTYRWPNVLIQFEDFSNESALTILEKYRYRYLCFNDDIQGTGSVTLAGIISALRSRGSTPEALCNERILVVGAGSAGLGVTNSLAWTMVTQFNVRHEEAFKQFYLVDQHGLLGNGRAAGPAQMRYVRHDMKDKMSIVEVIKEAKPTILLGLTGIGGLFTEEIVREMYKNCKRPIIFPLSNPTANAECSAQNAYEWTDGNAIFASGSPFDPVTLGLQTFTPSQCNNMFIFPALGLAANLVRARRISYNMLNKAGLALANSLTMEERASGMLFPHINRIRSVSKEVAVAVARAAFSEGLAQIKEPADLELFISSAMYQPDYAPLISPRNQL